MGEITVSTKLGPAQAAALERQLSLQLGGVGSKIRTLHAALELGEEQMVMRDVKGTMQRSGQQYQCTLDVELVSGARLSIIIVNADPQVCMVDAVARVRRGISRELRRFKLTERAVPALGM